MTHNPLSGTTAGLFPDSSTVSSKFARLKLSNHCHDKTSESDAFSNKGNNSIQEDVKVSQGVNIIVARDTMKDATADSTSHDHCVLQLIPYFLIVQKDPVIAGVEVIEGTAKIGTPLCMPSRDNIYIGRITSMYDNYSAITSVGKGKEAMIKTDLYNSCILLPPSNNVNNSIIDSLFTTFNKKLDL